MYDRKGYKRRKKGILIRALGQEECYAFQTIRNKWDLTDRAINKLLRTYTVTEIIEGDMDDGQFTPGNRLSQKCPCFPNLILCDNE